MFRLLGFLEDAYERRKNECFSKKFYSKTENETILWQENNFLSHGIK